MDLFNLRIEKLSKLKLTHVRVHSSKSGISLLEETYIEELELNPSYDYINQEIRFNPYNLSNQDNGKIYVLSRIDGYIALAKTILQQINSESIKLSQEISKKETKIYSLKRIISINLSYTREVEDDLKMLIQNYDTIDIEGNRKKLEKYNEISIKLETSIYENSMMKKQFLRFLATDKEEESLW